ncbi:ATP-binding protein [Streptomyces sp. NPDC054765]
MTADDSSLRRLPWTGEDGRPCYLSTAGTGPVSRLADRVEAARLGLADGLLDRARDVRADSGWETEPEPGVLAARLADALRGTWAQPPAAPQAWGLQALPGGDLSSAGAARQYVRAMACCWSVGPEQADALELITGELVANALRHGNSRLVVVMLSRTARTVCISVTDEGRGCVSALLARPGPEQECGRGLLIVEALADRWGQRKPGGGFTVWAEVVIKR